MDIKTYYASLRAAAQEKAARNTARARENRQFRENDNRLAELEGDREKEKALEREKTRRREENRTILASMGLTERDLSPVYACEKCNDTGFVGTKLCPCFYTVSQSLNGSVGTDAKTLPLVDEPLAKQLGLFEVHEKLRRYQEERWIIPTHVYDFLQWVTERFEACVQYISEKYSAYRDQKHYIVGRFNNMYAAFMLTADLVGMYALECGFWNREDQRGVLQDVQTGLEIELDIMEERFRQRDKATQVLRVFKEALERNQITPVQLNRDSCMRGEELYEDARCYYVTTKYLRLIVKQYGAAYSDTQRVINNEDLIAVLDRKEALDVIEKDGKRIRSRKLPIQRGNTKRYLYLIKEILGHLEEE